MAQIVRDYMRDLEQRPEGSRVAMAHRRVDVRALNEDIRAARQERGELARGAKVLGRTRANGYSRPTTASGHSRRATASCFLKTIATLA